MSAYADKVAAAESFCGKRHYVGQKDTKEGIIVKAGTLRCKSWFCSDCAKKNARKVIARLLSMNIDHGWWHQVITWDPANGDQAFSVANIGKRWSLVRRDLQKRWPHFRACWVLELTKQGYAHLHMICNMYVLPSYLQELCIKHKICRITFTRGIKDRNCALYLTKYIAKFAAYSPELMEYIAQNQPRKYQFCSSVESTWQTHKSDLADVWVSGRPMNKLLDLYFAVFFGHNTRILAKGGVFPWQIGLKSSDSS